jgi:ABC-2 type transport system ATP-binding protein
VIEVRDLVKIYRNDVRALNGLSIDVREGEVFGLLGPNGAGKSTLVRVLSTLLRPDGGQATVAGYDIRQPDKVRRRIGLVGQHAAVDEKLTGRENLRMFGRLYHLRERGAQSRAEELIEQFGLSDAAGRSVRTYSGGMRRRLDIAASLVVAPAVLFVDEPTTGLDPQGRAEVWKSLRQLSSAGTTVVLTTQYLDEADQLADRIAVIDKGQLAARGTPAELKAKIGADRLEVVLREARDLPATASAVAAATGTPPQVHEATRTVTVPVHDGFAMLIATVRELDQAGIAAQDIGLRRPTLDDVFLHLTGEGSR